MCSVSVTALFHFQLLPSALAMQHSLVKRKKGSRPLSQTAGFQFQVNTQEPCQVGNIILKLQTMVQKPGEAIMTCNVYEQVVFGRLSKYARVTNIKLSVRVFLQASLIFTLLSHLWLGPDTYKRSLQKRFLWKDTYKTPSRTGQWLLHGVLSLHLLFFFFQILFIYFQREGKGGRKKGRETSVCGYLSHGPHWGPGRQPRHVLQLGIEPAILWFAACAQSTELHQPGNCICSLKTASIQSSPGQYHYYCICNMSQDNVASSGPL